MNDYSDARSKSRTWKWSLNAHEGWDRLPKLVKDSHPMKKTLLSRSTLQDRQLMVSGGRFSMEATFVKGLNQTFFRM
jgi:hypothetical protein